MILLDTCAVLWLAADQSKLSTKAKKVIKNNTSSLFVSAISGFEIAIKYRNKKLELPLPPEKWFEQVIRYHGIKEIPITAQIAITSALLKPIHNDPCDRMIIATGYINKMKIITGDANIAAYKEVVVVW